MTTATALTTWVQDQLQGIPQTTVYVGGVPTQVPLIDMQRIKPYIVIWPSTSGNPINEALSGGGEGSTWWVTVTVAAADPVTVLKVADVVRERLHRVVTPGLGRIVQDDSQGRVQLEPDPAVKPGRYFLPLEYTTATST